MRYFWLVIFVLSVGSVSAQNSARVRELEKQRKAALAEIEMTSQLLDETRQTARNSLNRLNLLSKQINLRTKRQMLFYLLLHLKMLSLLWLLA